VKPSCRRRCNELTSPAPSMSWPSFMPPSPIRRGSGHRPAPRQVSPTPSFPRPFIPPAPGTAPADAARPGGRTRPRTRASARASASRRLLRRGGVGPQGGEGLEQERLLPGVAQDRVRESLDGAVPVQERSGRARADPGDAREAIGGVAHQGEVVGDEGRVDAELPPHGCGVADLALQGGGARLRGAPALAATLPDDLDDALAFDALGQVLVRGPDADVPAPGSAPAMRAADARPSSASSSTMGQTATPMAARASSRA
jgi:hypothetical protein